MRLPVLALAFSLAALLQASGAATYGDAEYLIDSWETDQGLPENSATAMVQTPDGYLWFGTYNGLVRFDGFKFTVFDASNTPELPSSGIINLHLDASQRLWVSTLRGLVVSEPNRWTTFRREPGWTADYVRTYSENAGVICATSFNGKVFRAQAGQFQELPEPPGEKGQGYHGYVDRTGRIWVAQRGYFYGSWDGQQWQSSKLAGVVTNEFLSLNGARDGSLLLVKNYEVLRIAEEKIVGSLKLPEDLFGAWSVAEDRHGTVWISARGLWRVDPSGQTRHFSSTNGLTYDGLRFAFEDRENNVWVGTSGGGLMRLKPRTFLTLGEKNGLTERNVTAVLEEAPGRILIGTFGGGLFAREGSGISRLETNRQPFSLWTQCLLLDRERQLWVGGYAGPTERSGLTILAPSGRRAVAPGDSGGANIRALYQDSPGRIWIGGDLGVSVFAQGKFSPQTPPKEIRLGDVRCFAENRLDGSIWAAAGEGLFRFFNGQWQEIKDASGKSIRDALCLRFEPDGTLWIGGAGVGLVRLKEGRWSSVTPDQGLPTRDMTCILEDDLGYWWMGSNRGVVRASRADVIQVADGTLPKLPCQVLNLSDGLASVECTMGMQSNGFKDSEGGLWLATLKGAATVNPRKFQPNTNPPPVFIETLRVENFAGDLRYINISPSDVRPTVVSPGSREISVFFTGLSLSAPEKMRFMYWIEGVDRDWRDIGNRRVIYFYPPPPGTYRLRVKAANNDGVWNEAGAIVAFTVLPQYWQTLWFRVLGVLVCGGGIAAAVGNIQRGRLQRAEEQWKQQEALARERARAAALTQHASDAITLLDHDGKVVYESPSTARIFGYPPGHLLGKDPEEFIHPEDQAAASQAMKEVFENTARGLPFTFRVHHAQGRWIHAEAVALNLMDFPGLEGILVATRDITERKRAEQALRESEERFRSLADASLEGVAVHDRGVILDVNQVFVRLFGYEKPEEIIGRNGLESLLDPESAARVQERIRRQEEGLIEIIGIRKDGSTFCAETESRPIKYKGRNARIVSCRDITERKQSEEALRHSEARFRVLVENAPEAIVVLDFEKGRFVDLNEKACRLFKLSRQEVLAKGPIELSPPFQPDGRPSDESAREKIARVIAGESPRFEWLHRNAQDEDILCEVNLTRLPSSTGILIRGSMVEIGDRKRLEEKLRESKKMEAIGQLAGGVAHDFNNILAATMMNLGLLLENPNLDRKTEHALKELVVDAQRAASLTRQLLMFSRRTVMEVTVLDLNDAVANMLKMLRRLIGEHIKLLYEPGSDLPLVEGDAGMLGQVLMNLTVNARDALPKGGRITIATKVVEVDEERARVGLDRRPGRFVCLSVADTGSGMDEATRQRIFEPFFTTKDVGQGTGLGLATVHGIVAQHRGWIEVESEVGQGTLFRVLLPASTRTATELEETGEITVAQATGHETILLVEDDSSVRSIVAQVLTVLGYRVVEAINGQDAVQVWQEQGRKIDLLFSDMVMPEGMTGLELAEKLRNEKPDLKIIISSGYSADLLQEGGRTAEGVVYLPKPYQTSVLGQVVRDCLDRK